MIYVRLSFDSFRIAMSYRGHRTFLLTLKVTVLTSLHVLTPLKVLYVLHVPRGSGK